jgi:oligopeptide/dipeptide ABC transporter ATP-binding protein
VSERLETASREPLLEVRDLCVDVATPAGPVRLVDGVSFEVYPDEAFCIVGESGSGKTVTMLAVMGLLPRGARIARGSVLFRGRDLAGLSARELRGMRGGDLAMIFQDPMTALNPVLSVGAQLAEMIRLHSRTLDRAAVRRRVVELLEQVRVPHAASRASAYPHEFSGGMRQRVMIAMAMANRPDLLIADEPTTALDVTIQAQVLDVLREMREDVGSALVLITHDLGVVAETADRVLVMYSGRVMETGTVEQLFAEPRHPYTAGLLASMLRMDTATAQAYAIAGQPPTPADRPAGCVFSPRCGLAAPPCTQTVPVLAAPDAAAPGSRVACHRSDLVPQWIRTDLPQLAGVGADGRVDPA